MRILRHFALKFTPKQAFLGDIFGRVWKMTPKRPLTESKTTLFLRNRHILTPKRELRLAQKTTLFCVFLWSRMYTAP